MFTRYQNRIDTDPDVMVGKPIIKGTRITVELILRQLGQGITLEEMLKNYPRLTRQDIFAAIEYAAELVEDEAAYPLIAHTHEKVKTFAR